VTGELHLLGEICEARANAAQSSTVMWLCAEQGQEWLRRDPRAEELALRLTSLKLRRAQDRAFDLMFGTASERVALVLLDLVDRLGKARGGQIVIDHGLTQITLAQLAGVCRETLSRVMADFKRRGWLTTSIGSCAVRDAAALRRHVRAAATGTLALQAG
jgi:CRP/FNR family transcriptional regulator